MQKTKGEQFAGVTVAMITPFRNGDVDFTALRRLVDWHVEQGTDCLAPAGTTGEAINLITNGVLSDDGNPPTGVGLRDSEGLGVINSRTPSAFDVGTVFSDEAPRGIAFDFCDRIGRRAPEIHRPLIRERRDSGPPAAAAARYPGGVRRLRDPLTRLGAAACVDHGRSASMTAAR